MFDMGFIDDIRFLLRHLPKPDVRQSFLYSATLSHRVLELAYEHMNRVERVAVSEEQITAENITQLVYHVGMHEKLSVLLGLLEREKPTRALVFVNMRSTAARIAERLEAQGHSAGALAGDMDQRKRLKLLSRLKDGSLKILVATDVASRGLHIDNVSHVFNYDLPQDPEDYVHRIGRTARAGLSGKAYSLACEKYVYSLEAIEDYLGAKLPHEFPDESLPVTPVRFRPKRKPQDDDRGGRRTSGRRSDGNRGRSSESGSPRTGSGEGGDKQPASTGGEKAAAPGDGEAVKKKGRRRRKKKPTDSGTSVPAE
jgi:ATP-dependent RNA helicase RhlB